MYTKTQFRSKFNNSKNVSHFKGIVQNLKILLDIIKNKYQNDLQYAPYN